MNGLVSFGCSYSSNIVFVMSFYELGELYRAYIIWTVSCALFHELINHCEMIEQHRHTPSPCSSGIGAIIQMSKTNEDFVHAYIYFKDMDNEDDR